jgi:omega-6 fatty acid desaturase (delta-12 desaturase)
MRYKIRKRAPIQLVSSSFLSIILGLSISNYTHSLNSVSTIGFWFISQILLAFGIFQSFIVIHEAGHRTLFKNKLINNSIGTLCSLFCLIPFYPWQFIHSKHHRWTGWKDIDPTTSKTLKRDLSKLQKLILDKAWAYSVPIFCPIYALDNFWNLPKLFQLTENTSRRTKFIFSTSIIIFSWIVTIYLLGPLTILYNYGLAFLLVLVIADPLMLSQHSHIHQELAGDKEVKPFPFRKQEIFTRSLSFPPWVSKYVLYGFDRHEAHHINPNLPGYQLANVNQNTTNDINALKWIKLAKSIPGHQLIFLTREETGIWL